MLHQKLPLNLPVTTFRCGDACLSLLEECSGKVARPARELFPFETAFDELIVVQNNHWGSADEQGEDVSILFRQSGERFADIPYVYMKQRSK